MSSKRAFLIFSFLFLNASLVITSCEDDKPTEPPPTSIQLDRTLLTYNAYRRDALPPEETFTISNGGSGTLEWSIIDTVTWLDVSPSAGVGNYETIHTTVTTTSLNTGTYNSSITVLSGNATNSPRIILLSYTLTQHPIVGTYDGIYRVISGYQTPSSDTTWTTIELLISDEAYFFNSDNNPDPFCNPRGYYFLNGNSIEFNETQRNCSSVVAKETDNPRGTFSMNLSVDSLIMTQHVSDILKAFHLARR